MGLKPGAGLLGGHPQAGVVLGNAVAGHDALDPQLLRGGDGQGAVAKIDQLALQEANGVDAHGGGPGGLRRLDAALGLPGDVFVGDPVQVGQGVLVLKDDGPQLFPVQFVPVIHGAEAGDQLCLHCLGGPGQVVVDGVGVDEHAAQGFQGLQDGGLPRPGGAGDANNSHAWCSRMKSRISWAGMPPSRRITGSSPVRSTMVDSTPMAQGPPSTMPSMCPSK